MVRAGIAIDSLPCAQRRAGADLWRNRGEKDFDTYVKYYLSDHRPMWMEFRAQ